MKKSWLEWPFESQGFIESPMQTLIEDRKVIIENTKITLQLKEDDTDDKGACSIEFLDKLDLQIKSCVNLLQLQANRKFILKKYGLYSSFGEGNLNVTVFPDPCYIKLSIEEVELVGTDNLGNEIFNQKRARLEHISHLMNLYSANGIEDETLRFILGSYDRSLIDPNFSLIALYDIRDALTIKFQKEDVVRKDLKISKKTWQRMGEIANELPLHQSRHLGKKLDKPLRNIEESELSEIRTIAKKMIESYLNYLNGT